MTKNTAFNFKKCTSEIIENIVKSKKVEAKCELKEGEKKLKTFLDDLFDSGSISIDNTKDKYLLNCAGRFLREEVLKDFIKGNDYLQFAIFKYRNKRINQIKEIYKLIKHTFSLRILFMMLYRFVDKMQNIRRMYLFIENDTWIATP